MQIRRFPFQTTFWKVLTSKLLSDPSLSLGRQTSELGVTEHIEGDPCKFALWVGRTPTSDNKTVLKVCALRNRFSFLCVQHRLTAPPPFPRCAGLIVGAEAGVGPQHPPGDPGEAGPPAGCSEGAHPPAQDPQPHPGAAAQHQPQVSRTG